MSLGEWLDTVVTDQVDEAGPAPRAENQQRRRDDVIDRLRQPGGQGQNERAPRNDSRSRQWDVEDHVSEPRSRSRSSRQRNRRDDHAEERHGRRDARFDDVEILLEDTLDDVERRFTRAQRRTDLALADVADLLETSESQRDASQTLFLQIAARLKAIETQLSGKAEPKLPAMGVVERPEKAVAAEPAAATADIQRLETKLNSVLAAVSSGRSDARSGKSQGAPHILREAVGEIAARQRDLGETNPGPLAARLQQRRHASPAERSDTALALVQLQREIIGLGGKLEELKRDVAAPAARRSGDDALSRIRDEIAALSQGLAELAPRRAVAALEATLANLSRQIDAAHGAPVREETLQELNQLVVDLRHSLTAADPRSALGGLEQEVMKIGGRLDRLAAAGFDPDAVSRIQSQTEEIRNLLTAASAHPLPFERIENEIAALTRRLERAPADAASGAGQRTAAELRSIIHESSEPALRDLHARIDSLSGKVSEAIDRASGDRHFAELAKRIDAVQQKIAAPGPVPGQSEVQSLAALVGTLADNLEAARQPQAGSAAIDVLQTQIAKLSERLDRSDSTFEAITQLQRTVGELFGQLEATRRVAEDATQSATRGADAERSGLDDVIAQEIAELRALQDQADRRSHATLNAVHGTLQKVVERLAHIEDETHAKAADTLALGPAPVFAPPPPKASALKPKAEGGFVANLLRGRAVEEPVARSLAPPPASVEDILIEPGMAFPGGPDARGQAPSLDVGIEPDVASGRSNFIAAARRAAQTAQKEADTLDARQAWAGAAEKPAGKRVFDGRKRVIVLSLAALFVIFGAYAVLRVTSEPAPQQRVSQAVTPPRHQAMVTQDLAPMAADTTLSPAALPQPGDRAAAQSVPGSDPIVTGSISAKPLAPPPVMAAPPAPPAANLRAAADAGAPGAEFELATRYAEGRLMPRDLKLAAQWYEKAALQGLAPAQYRLGSMYEKGLGVTRDLARAKTWYQKAADAGNARAMHNLAVLTAEGTDNKPDYAGAAAWFRKAAELGIRDSQYNLAILLARGLGQPVNLVQSYVWFAAAAAQGDDDAGKKRDDVGGRLDAKDLAAAKAIVAASKPIPLDPAANDVATPVGGWDVSTPAAAAPVKVSKPKISAL